jgi:ATP-binding cassette, subfamily F, member 3
MGELQPTEGEIKRSNGARFALVNQHHTEQIELSLTPLVRDIISRRLFFFAVEAQLMTFLDFLQEFLKKLFPGDGSYEHVQKLRGHLSSCGVTSGSSTAVAANSSIAGGGTKVKDLQNTPSSALSGGQRSRVALAAVSYTRPHVLVLVRITLTLRVI